MTANGYKADKNCVLNLLNIYLAQVLYLKKSKQV